MNDEDAILVSNLTKRYGPLLAVDGVSLAVRRGDVLGFLGPNGAGKTTTMRMITGFIEPSAGSVTVCGCPLATDPIGAKRHIGYLPEGAPAYGEMTPLGYLQFVAEIRGLRGDRQRQRIDQAIAAIHLDAVLHQPIETLSKGFKRRVGLAQAILHDPDVLILDEPTDGLDPNQKHEVRQLIADMARNKAIVISTHILEEVDAVCNRAVIIAAGRLVFEGTPADLAAKSRYHNAVHMTVDEGADGDISAALSRLPGVDKVERLKGALVVLPRNGSSIVGEVSNAARQHGWKIRELHVDSGHLDEVFREITRASGAGELRT